MLTFIPWVFLSFTENRILWFRWWWNVAGIMPSYVVSYIKLTFDFVWQITWSQTQIISASFRLGLIFKWNYKVQTLFLNQNEYLNLFNYNSVINIRFKAYHYQKKTWYFWIRTQLIKVEVTYVRLHDTITYWQRKVALNT